MGRARCSGEFGYPAFAGLISAAASRLAIPSPKLIHMIRPPSGYASSQHSPLEHVLSTYVLGTGNVSPNLAFATLSDHLGPKSFATVIKLGNLRWVNKVIKDLGLDEVTEVPEFLPSDTVIGPPDVEYVKAVTDAGAVYLDITEGLVPLEASKTEELPESPDVDSVEPAVETSEEKPKPLRKRKPLAKNPPKAETIEPDPDPVVEEVVSTQAVDSGKPDYVEPDLCEPPADDAAVTVKLGEVVWQTLGSTGIDFHLREVARALFNQSLESMAEESLWSLVDTLRGQAGNQK